MLKSMTRTGPGKLALRSALSTAHGGDIVEHTNHHVRCQENIREPQTASCNIENPSQREPVGIG